MLTYQATGNRVDCEYTGIACSLLQVRSKGADAGRELRLDDRVKAVSEKGGGAGRG